MSKDIDNTIIRVVKKSGIEINPEDLSKIEEGYEQEKESFDYQVEEELQGMVLDVLRYVRAKLPHVLSTLGLLCSGYAAYYFDLFKVIN